MQQTNRPHLRSLAALALALQLAACAEQQVAALPEGTPEAPAATPEAPTTVAPLAPPPDGRFIADAREYPWSAIGRLNTGGRGFCTAILIGVQEVLARAGCLVNRNSGAAWPAQEVFFLAGYQRDSYLAASRAAAIQIAPGYKPSGGSSLGNLAADWALVTLEKPVGRQAGWLGLGWMETTAKWQVANGSAQIITAGYRRDWQHALYIYYGCGEATEASSSASDNCRPLPGERHLPRLFLSGDELRVIADAFFGSPQALPAGVGSQRTSVDGLTGSPGHRPQVGSPADQGPLTAIDRLLWQLGDSPLAPEEATRASRRAAIERFQAGQGEAPTGDTSISLLGQLIDAAQRRSTG